MKKNFIKFKIIQRLVPIKKVIKTVDLEEGIKNEKYRTTLPLLVTLPDAVWLELNKLLDNNIIISIKTNPHYIKIFCVDIEIKINKTNVEDITVTQ